MKCTVADCGKKLKACGLCAMHYARKAATGDLERTPRPTPLERFESKVIKGDGCWEWLGATYSFGYGAFILNGTQIHASRAAWILYCGPIPAGLNVLHRCDNPQCTNPKHLFLGTQKENVRDCVSKGRFKPPRLKGEAHGRARLTAGQVMAIRAAAAAGASQTALGNQYGVRNTTINAIVLRHNWKHI